nr:MAG TPA: hypothetical protein [Crassvirales sp.]
MNRRGGGYWGYIIYSIIYYIIYVREKQIFDYK